MNNMRSRQTTALMVEELDSAEIDKQRMRKKKCFLSPFVMILKGTAKVIMKDDNGAEIEVAELRSGEIFGLSDLLKIIVRTKPC